MSIWMELLIADLANNLQSIDVRVTKFEEIITSKMLQTKKTISGHHDKQAYTNNQSEQN